jgi:hypothetical protein
MTEGTECNNEPDESDCACAASTELRDELGSIMVAVTTQNRQDGKSDAAR